MRKVWSTLVILAILVGMLVCMGAEASAEEGPRGLAIVAVSGGALDADQITKIRESEDMSGKDVVVINVDALEEPAEGYDYVYAAEQKEGKVLYPGMETLPVYELTESGETKCKVVLLPVGSGDGVTSESLNETLNTYTQDGTTVVSIAIAPAGTAVQAAVDSDATKVLTCGETEASGDELIRVGGDETNPVSVITVNTTGLETVTAMAKPEAASTGVGPQETQTYTVSFQPGEGASGEMAAVTVNAGEDYELPQYCDFSHDGYTFIGWSIDGTEYKVFDPVEWTYTTRTVKVEGDITATALWQAQAVQYSVSYMPGEIEGVEITGVMTPATMDQGASYALLANGFAAEGYEFQGWQIDGGETKQPGDTVTVNSDMTATATWAKSSVPGEPVVNDKYTVTFHSGLEDVGDFTASDKVMGDTIILSDLAVDDLFGVAPGGVWPPEGKTFKGWKQTAGEGAGDEIKAAGTEISVNGNMEFTAQWDTAEPAVPPQAELTVSYKYNEQTITDEVKYSANSAVTLRIFAETGFTAAAPEGQMFKAWKLGETEYTEGTEYTLGSESVTFEAVFQDIPAESFTVTFDANGGSGAVAAMTAAPNGIITLPGGSSLTAPSTSQGFAGWKIGEQTYLPGAQYTVTASVTALAQWSELQDAGGQVDTLKWTKGGTDALTATFAAAIDTVKMDGTLLVANTHYHLTDDNKTVQFYNDYLNSLTEGNHTATITFGLTQGGVAPAAVYAPKDIPLYISADPNKEAAPTSLQYTWNDRTQPLTINIPASEGTPTALQIDYGSKGGLRAPQGNTNYTVSGSTLTLQPDLVNKNNGGSWPAGQYGFKVITNSGANPYMRITLTSAPTNTNPNSNTSGGTSPVTGDTNNVVLWIVLLAVLVLALVVVIVIMVKRRKNGRG